MEDPVSDGAIIVRRGEFPDGRIPPKEPMKPLPPDPLPPADVAVYWPEDPVSETTPDLQAGWDAAINECLTGHEGDGYVCTFGGLTPSDGYWLAAEDCTLPHHDTCAWCTDEPVTAFRGWEEDTIYGVPACDEHANLWLEANPGKWKRLSA